MQTSARRDRGKPFRPTFAGTALVALTACAASALAQEPPQSAVLPTVSAQVPAGTLRSLRDAPDPPPMPRPDLEVESFPLPAASPQIADVEQRASSASATSPSLIVNFAGIDSTHGAGIPPDPVGAAGQTQYVEAVNSSIAVFDKAGNVLMAPKSLQSLWTNYVGTNPGNNCAARNDGDPLVVYDKAADRWVVAQFSVPNSGTNFGPSFECVAVSQTSDATGAYWLYDFQYNAALNDTSKLAVWTDAYYFSTNLFGSSAFIGPDYCAFDRAAMLAGHAATQICFLQSPTQIAGVPADLDGSTPPPAGAPGYFVGYGSTTSKLNLLKLHADFANTSNSTLTPIQVDISAYGVACGSGNGGGTCVAQPSPGALLPALGDRIMFRVAYRNFGDHESIVAAHAVAAGSLVDVRWYELRSPGSTPVVYQSATFAPDSVLSRWIPSIAMDRKGNIALGYSLSGATKAPSIYFAGRLAGDTLNDMGGESALFDGAHVETSAVGGFTRWGDFSTLTIDPTDDCTFWYTNQYYASNGVSTWATRIGALRFSGCLPTATTTLLSTACSRTYVAGQPFTMTAAVTPSAATGTVDFDNGLGTLLCSAVALQSGAATCASGPQAPGNYTLGAAYTGNADDEPSSSNSLSVSVLSASDVLLRATFETVPAGCPAQ